MTIAVAGAFPWGKLSELRGSPLDQGVVLASDSRFTIGSQRDDSGRKAYPLTRNAGFVFAGDVLAAQSANRRIRELLERKRAASQKDTAEEVAALIAGAYESQVARASAGHRPRPGPLTMLFGVLDEASRQAYAVQISSRSAFRPIYIPGVAVAGSKGDIQRVRELLAKYQEEALSAADGKALTLSSAKFQIASALAQTVGESNLKSSIGGPIQLLSVSSQGLNASEMLSRYDGDIADSVFEAAKWTQITVPLEQVYAYRPTYGPAGARLPDPEDDLDFEMWSDP